MSTEKFENAMAVAIDLARDFREAPRPPGSGDAFAEAILEMCLDLAEEHFLSGKYELAEEMLRKAEQISPEARKEFQAGIVESAQANIGEEKFPEAKAQFEAVLHLDENNVEYLAGLGESLLGMGEKGQARQAFEEALSREERPDDLGVYERMGVIAFKSNEHELALAAFDRAVSLFPANPVLYYRMGVIHMGRGQFQDALAQIKKALRIRPVYPEAEKLSQKITEWVEKFEGLAREKEIEE